MLKNKGILIIVAVAVLSISGVGLYMHVSTPEDDKISENAVEEQEADKTSKDAVEEDEIGDKASKDATEEDRKVDKVSENAMQEDGKADKASKNAVEEQEADKASKNAAKEERKAGKTPESTDKKEENSDKSDNGLAAFYGYDLPLRFSLDYTEKEDGYYQFDIQDKGDHYLVKGALICPECVETSVLQEAEVGDHFFTGSGRGYTVSSREGYNEDQREKVVLLGDDGKTYTVWGIPAFLIDAYLGTAYYTIESEDGEQNYKTFFENVELPIAYDTQFPDGDSFDSYIKSGGLDDVWFSIAYDIHFTKDGKIDILTGADVGSNGPWDSNRTVMWKACLE